jgi:hypothetical protein
VERVSTANGLRPSGFIRHSTPGEEFADASPFPFVRDTWESLVVPHQGFFIGLLILGEAAAGALILSGGRRTQVGLMALIWFHIGQLAFGGVLWIWAPLMLVALVLLLRAERRAHSTPPVGLRSVRHPARI